MDKSTELEKLKNLIGINNFSTVTNAEFKKIQEFAAEDAISKEQMKLLVESIPHFVQLQQTYVEGLKSVINAAKESQKDALRGISATLENITDLLKAIVEKSETDELRSRIAEIALKLADYGLEIAKILKEANRENNDTWKYIAGSVGAVVALIGGIFIMKKR